MKTIKYILTAIMISSILFSAIPFKHLNAQECITLACTADNPDEDKLIKSANIIENRLKTVGIKTTKVTVTGEESKIEICFKNTNDLKKAEVLLTAKGKFEFYETLDRKEVIKHLKEDDELYSVLNINESPDKLISVLGFCNEAKKPEVDKYLISLKGISNEDMKFAWSIFKEKGNVYLYLLKPEASLCGDRISDSKSEPDKTSKQHAIWINLDKQGAKKFREITAKNIGKIVAIVLDGYVYSAPMVMAEINGGKLVISGDFSSDEAALIVALVKNGELPLEFEIVK